MISKRQVLVLILIFSVQFVFSQDDSYLDSLIISSSKNSKKNQLNTILNIPYDKAVGNISAFEKLADKAILISRELGDSLLLAASFEQKILALHFTSKNEEALNLSLRTIRIYEKLNAQLNVGKIYSDLGWKLKYRDFSKAFAYMEKGIKILKENNPKSQYLFESYDNFGVLHGMKKQWDSALHYHLKV